MANTSISIQGIAYEAGLLDQLEIDTLEELCRALAFAEGMVDHGAEVRSLCAEASAFMGDEGRQILDDVIQDACSRQAENQKNAGL